jgi:GT2 family glycosyltransferase
MKIGLGVVTYNRPDYFNKTIKGVIKHLKSHLDLLCVYNDCSTIDYSYPPEIDVIYKPKKNHGVARAKNTLLKSMIDYGCDYLFLLEDDVIPQSEKAIAGYIEAHKKSGYHHFNFHDHGPANKSGFLDASDVITIWPHCVGAYSFYTKECIEKVGYMDENFKNAWEHVEHTARIAKEGMHPPFWFFVDATGSENWLKEIEGSIQNSSIRQDEEWKKNMQKGLEYWKEKDGIGLPVKPYEL